MSANEEYALRIANGEKLSAILDEVYADGWWDANKKRKPGAETSAGGDDSE